MSLYHDQVSAVLKGIDFHGVVSVTLGLPFPRLSVDHGTALDIAGTNTADAANMRATLERARRWTAVPIHDRRRSGMSDDRALKAADAARELRCRLAPAHLDRRRRVRGRPRAGDRGGAVAVHRRPVDGGGRRRRHRGDAVQPARARRRRGGMGAARRQLREPRVRGPHAAGGQAHSGGAAAVRRARRRRDRRGPGGDVHRRAASRAARRRDRRGGRPRARSRTRRQDRRRDRRAASAAPRSRPWASARR